MSTGGEASRGPDFKDHFSGHAADYARFRPGYPPALFNWLSMQAPGTGLAWDVGTGNGQVAQALVAHMSRVHATDASRQQLAQTTGNDRVRFCVESAEACSLTTASVDLVTVGQALHWFDLERFYPEVRRVLRSQGVLAAWTYQLNQINDEIDEVIEHFYNGVIGAFWPPERIHVERGYADLPFPFEAVEAPAFALETIWTLTDYLGYIGTWSAVHRYRAREGIDPLPDLRQRLEAVWGDPNTARVVHWPLALRVGRRD